MHRTQISLEPEHYGFLSAEARRLGVSMAEVVRRIVEERMAKGQKPDPFADLVGAGEGDGNFSGADHDRVLYGDRGE
ncbi:MAG: ribbon-helix-helix domain-containing protein [Geminicoccaceae bacterium]